MPMVTSSRRRSEVWPRESFTWGGLEFGDIAQQSATAFGYESVNSWRTQVRRGETDDEDSQFVQGSGSQSGFANELKAEYERHSKSSFDTGHEFNSLKVRYTFPSYETCTRFNYFEGNPRVAQYTGTLVPIAGTLDPPNVDIPSGSEMDADGMTLMGLAVPTRTEANLAQFFGEMRERLPSLIGLESVMKGAHSRTLGSEFLNIEFGIKPFVNDLQKLSRAVLKAHTLVNQYIRDSERPVRRRRSLQDSTGFADLPGQYSSINSNQMPKPFPGLSTLFFQYYPAETKVFDFVHRRTWFSGAFTYYVHTAHSLLEKLERFGELANHLLGTRLTADVIWQLTPWSWLFDWFGTMGNFLSLNDRLTSDSLVLKYGYVMHQIDATRTYTKTGCLAKDGEVPSTISAFVDLSSKNRRRATPYGFGVDLEALSPERLAILGALGLSHGPRNLGL